VVNRLSDSILNLVFQRIADSYQAQVPYYEQMLGLAKKQTELLEKEDVDIEQLIRYINERQGLIETLESLNKGINQLKQEINETMGIEEFNLSRIKARVSGSGVDALTASLDRLGELLTRIKELDAHNEEKLRRTIEQTRGKLNDLQAAKKMNKAYQGEPQADGGVFIDYSK
jgi:flagellar biosynthesis/type III secretory pathway chaperone